MIAERIRQELAGASFTEHSVKKRVTLSIGVAVQQNELDLDSHVQASDMALYQAKSEGRNCVRCAV